jgi:hypothetical protein
MREIIEFCKKPTQGTVLYDRDPAKLVERCVQALYSSPQWR